MEPAAKKNIYILHSAACSNYRYSMLNTVSYKLLLSNIPVRLYLIIMRPVITFRLQWAASYNNKKVYLIIKQLLYIPVMIRYRLRYKSHKLIKTHVCRFKYVCRVSVCVNAFSLCYKGMQVVILDSRLNLSVLTVQFKIIHLGYRIINLLSTTYCSRYIELCASYCHVWCRSAVFGDKSLNILGKYPLISGVCLGKDYYPACNIRILVILKHHNLALYPLGCNKVRSCLIYRNNIKAQRW